MKKKNATLILCAVTLGVACVIIALSGHRDSKIVRSLPDYEERIWEENGGIFRDCVKYGEYTYEEIYPEEILECEEFQTVDMYAVKELKKYASDFEKRVDGDLTDGSSKERELAVRCSFYADQIDEGDYYILYIGGEEDDPTFYEFYYFDLSEKKLFYIYADVIGELEDKAVNGI